MFVKNWEGGGESHVSEDAIKPTGSTEIRGHAPPGNFNSLR